jgi:hypothetical protein
MLVALLKNPFPYARFEVLTAVMKVANFWDITPKRNEPFARTYHGNP